MTDEEKTDKVDEAIEAVEEAKEEITEAKEEVQEAEEAIEEAGEAIEEVIEEVKVEEKPEKPIVPKEPKEPKEKPEPSGKFKDLIKTIETMTVLELSELVKALEDRFGVSASAPVAIGAATVAGAGTTEAEEEKSAYNIVLTASGGNKIGVIKALREILPDLGLKEAKDMAEGAPITVKENVKKEEAEGAKEKLVAAGATVELQ